MSSKEKRSPGRPRGSGQGSRGGKKASSSDARPKQNQKKSPKEKKAPVKEERHPDYIDFENQDKVIERK